MAPAFRFAGRSHARSKRGFLTGDVRLLPTHIVMSTRLQLRLFRGGTAATFREAVGQATSSLGGTIALDQHGPGASDLRFSSRGEVHSLYIPYQDAALPFCQEIGRILDCPWIEIRIQEGALWDYALYRGSECVDTFSVAPEYWEEPEDITVEYLLRWRGDPQKLAALWQLPLASIERYIVSWGFHVVDEDTSDFRLKGKAYPTDEYEYGNSEQMYDVLKTLGGEFPIGDHSLILPTRRNGV